MPMSPRNWPRPPAPQAAFPVLREEAVPARAASDIAFMRKFCE